MRVLVTGANGFIGKNLIERLARYDHVDLLTFKRKDDIDILTHHLKDADIVFHLAGINRPDDIKDFNVGNVDLTRKIVDILEKTGKKTPIVLTSSIQASLDNPYGISKKAAEDILIEYSQRNDTKIYIYRLPNVFGKWCRPNYNSAVATFCYNISHGIELFISDKNNEIELIYIDNVVSEFARLLSDKDADNGKYYHFIEGAHKIALGELVKKLRSFKNVRKTLIVPDLSDDFTRYLHATYLSYLDRNDFSYPLDTRVDERGSLAELIKSEHFGQIFVSTTHKGVTRGNHYHNTKIEKFCVLKGKAVIKFRHIFEKEITSYFVSGDKIEVVDVPPGYTHSIENLGGEDMIVLFWANQIFDKENPETYFLEVQK